MERIKRLEMELELNAIELAREANYNLLIQRANLKEMLLEAYRLELYEKQCNIPKRLAS